MKLNRSRSILYALPVLALALMGQACPAQDQQVRNLLSVTCPAVDVAYQHYVAVKSVVSVRVQGNVELFKRTNDRFCADPSTATTISVLANASAAYLAIREAIAQARASGVVEVAKINRLENSVEAIRDKIGYEFKR